MAELWPNVAILSYGIEHGTGSEPAMLTGCAVPLRARVELAGLQPEDVRVEAVIGRVGAEGELADMQRRFAVSAICTVLLFSNIRRESG